MFRVALAAMSAAALTALGAAAPANAQSARANLTIDLPGNASITRIAYVCGEEEALMMVDYITSPPNYLVMFDVEDGRLLLASIVADTALTFVAGPYQWIVEGPAARLFDARLGDEPLKICVEAEDIP